MNDDQTNQNSTDDQEDTSSQPVSVESQAPDPEESEKPEISEVTAKPEDQKASEPEKPEASVNPEESEDQKVSEPENPEKSDDQKVGNSQHSDQPDTSDSSEPSDLSDISDTSDSSDSSDLSDKSDISDSSEEEPLSPSPQLKNDVPGAHWFVVHTYSGHEAKVAATLKQRVESQQLQDKVLDILVPTQEKIEIKEGRKNKVKEKIFPGYLLIRMVLDDNTWLVVRTTPGITSFVGMGNKPTPLPDAEVASIQRFMSMEAPKFKASFSVGEAVKIVDGPFSEFLGSISEIDNERGKIKVLVSIFGRETPVELDFLQVAKL